MLSAAENERLTRSGAGTPLGRLMRRYWQPVALSEELSGPRPLVALEVLGERLVAFRDEAGRVGLLDRHCPHRGADLAFGRLEDGGLRCAFHGWLFDTAGQCLEQPAEPEGSRFHCRIRQPARPCREVNGVVFAYLGEGEPPPLPSLDCLAAPDAYTFAFKGFMECNWLQALEVGIDPAHASFLHRFLDDGDPDAGYGLQFRGKAAAETQAPLTSILRDYPRPRIEVDTTEYGLRITARRELADGRTHTRLTNQVFPHAIVIPMSPTMTITQWHVPVDDLSCYWYAMFTSFEATVDKALMRRQRLELYEIPGYVPRRNRSNQYGYDPAEQRTRTYTGMGDDINVHDQWACESMGPLQDRTREHLGMSDVAIRAYRRLLAQSMERAVEGGELPRLDGDTASRPVAVDVLADGPDAWRRREAERRRACPWIGDRGA